MKDDVNVIFNKITSSDTDEIRADLLKLRDMLKTGLSLDKDRVPVIQELLLSDDPKVRQNAAKCLEQIKDESSLIPLFDAYRSDDIRYNKPVYLKAMSVLDVSVKVAELKSIRDELAAGGFSDEDRKHIIEEMRVLNSILRPYIYRRHVFCGEKLVNEAALLMNRDHKDITGEELGKIPHKDFNAGIMVKTAHLDKVLGIRTFSELLFVPELKCKLSKDTLSAARIICESGFVKYLCERHEPLEGPFFFRVEYKQRNEDIKQKAAFEKSMAAELETASNWQLVNSVDDYELELRFIEAGDGSLRLLLKDFTLSDKRFSYRKASISTGIKPSLAALLMHLSKDYIQDNAVVMDLMCGSGILLIERDIYRPVRLLYGIDIYGPALEAAKKNVKAAGIDKKTELINRDIKDFTHKHEVDEIYADTPVLSSSRSGAELAALFDIFFKKAGSFLSDRGHVFVYTHNKDLLTDSASKNGFVISERFEISKMEKSWYIIFSRR